MKLNYELVGTLNITADEIDITDPCYDKDVWCRTRKPITPGEYNCYVGIGSNKNWGARVYMLILLAADVDLDSKGDVENVGTIGVDAGMAGFFENKPDYSDEEKGLAVLKIVNMETHNSIRKDDMLKVIRWLLELSFELPEEKP